jgi:hypothetical protein
MKGSERCSFLVSLVVGNESRLKQKPNETIDEPAAVRILPVAVIVVAECAEAFIVLTIGGVSVLVQLFNIMQISIVNETGFFIEFIL